MTKFNQWPQEFLTKLLCVVLFFTLGVGYAHALAVELTFVNLTDHIFELDANQQFTDEKGRELKVLEPQVRGFLKKNLAFIYSSRLLPDAISLTNNKTKAVVSIDLSYLKDAVVTEYPKPVSYHFLPVEVRLERFGLITQMQSLKKFFPEPKEGKQDG